MKSDRNEETRRTPSTLSSEMQLAFRWLTILCVWPFRIWSARSLQPETLSVPQEYVPGESAVDHNQPVPAFLPEEGKYWTLKLWGRYLGIEKSELVPTSAFLLCLESLGLGVWDWCGDIMLWSMTSSNHSNTFKRMFLFYFLFLIFWLPCGIWMTLFWSGLTCAPCGSMEL